MTLLFKWLFGKRFTMWDMMFIFALMITFDHFGWSNLWLCIPWIIIGMNGERIAAQ